MALLHHDDSIELPLILGLTEESGLTSQGMSPFTDSPMPGSHTRMPVDTVVAFVIMRARDGSKDAACSAC